MVTGQYVYFLILYMYVMIQSPLKIAIGYTKILIAFTQKTAFPFDEGSESFSTSLLYQNIYSVKKGLLNIIW